MKPLADHGTTARAKGRPAAGIKACPCRPCRDAENAYDKRRRFLNETGRAVRVDSTPVTAHLKALFADGAGWDPLVAVTGCSSSTLVAILHGQRPKISRRVASQILAVNAQDAIPPRQRIPGIGSVRRCRGLIAAGHRVLDITESSPLDNSTVRYLINSAPERVTLPTAAGVLAACAQLAKRSGTSRRSLNRAAREGWAPLAAWDDIDDLNAQPDWTGHCGSDRGWWSHRLTGIPVCPPCDTAHTQWKADHRHLPQSDFMSAMGRSRASASNRGQSIAADGRELLAQGCDYETAAARIGVTRQHLQQELIRHPEPAEQELAA
ncbi:hypothetical protein [Streptomyces scopuliridis]|uniref:hypothetical protein n=1 Tax=Streptomyces scopuliridis TaxID=452529 RepID=UPI003421E185